MNSKGGGDPEKRFWERIPSLGVLALVVLTPIATITTLILGLRELLDLNGPGWSVVLAWFAVALTSGAIAAFYVEQFRHRNEIRELHRSNSEALERYRRNAAVAVALPDMHLALHDLRDAAVMIRGGDSPDAY